MSQSALEQCQDRVAVLESELAKLQFTIYEHSSALSGTPHSELLASATLSITALSQQNRALRAQAAREVQDAEREAHDKSQRSFFSKHAIELGQERDDLIGLNAARRLEIRALENENKLLAERLADRLTTDSFTEQELLDALWTNEPSLGCRGSSGMFAGPPCCDTMRDGLPTRILHWARDEHISNMVYLCNNLLSASSEHRAKSVHAAVSVLRRRIRLAWQQLRRECRHEQFERLNFEKGVKLWGERELAGSVRVWRVEAGVMTVDRFYYGMVLRNQEYQRMLDGWRHWEIRTAAMLDQIVAGASATRHWEERAGRLWFSWFIDRVVESEQQELMLTRGINKWVPHVLGVALRVWVCAVAARGQRAERTRVARQRYMRRWQSCGFGVWWTFSVRARKAAEMVDEGFWHWETMQLGWLKKWRRLAAEDWVRLDWWDQAVDWWADRNLKASVRLWQQTSKPFSTCGMWEHIGRERQGNPAEKANSSAFEFKSLTDSVINGFLE